MTSRSALFLAVLGAFAWMGGVAVQAAPTYEIDPEHSGLIFKIKNRNVTYVYGRFNTISGTIVTDSLRSPSTIEVTAEVQTKSLDTNVDKRDRHLKGNEFFNATKNPAITFKTKSCKRVDEDHFELVGDLTLLGVTKELTVTFERTGETKIEMAYLLGGQVTFTIKRSEFGMNAMIPDIADEVTIMVSLEGKFNIPPSG